MKNDLLIELQTEELPPKSLLTLAKAFCQGISDGLVRAGLQFDRSKFYATPRRLAVQIEQVDGAQPDQMIEKRGPTVSAAFTAEGKPTTACLGFAKSLGVKPTDLIRIKNDQGEWVGYQQHRTGAPLDVLLPEILSRTIDQLPINKRMRWNSGEAEFVRPVHHIIVLFGNKVLDLQFFGLDAGRVTVGHRFNTSNPITIPDASAYESLLASEGRVIADFSKRRRMILDASLQIAETLPVAQPVTVVMPDELLDEVTGLVEMPHALYGHFDANFLSLPTEVLISAMQDHQRYFPVKSTGGELLPYFIIISNIDPHDPKRIVQGNERVLRARLADAAFFYETDKKIKLADRVSDLGGIIFQAKLGTMLDRAKRLEALATYIADQLKVPTHDAARAGYLAKADLTTLMVNEFPELQGTMGFYYANYEGEPESVAQAIKEHYMPRFSGDLLPETLLGSIVALADRIDILVGVFGISQIPTGDKDPFGLRRAAIGLIRLLIEKKINLDLSAVLTYAKQLYPALPNQNVKEDILQFVEDRMRIFFAERGVSPDVFAAVSALHIHDPLNVDARIKAVQAFKKLTAAEALSIANKRVSNILAKYDEPIDAKSIDASIFEHDAERKLAREVELKSNVISQLIKHGQYNEILLKLAELRQPIDDFFDQVMVLTDDKTRRENRILLLSKLRALFLQVADIALLQ